MNAIDLLRKQHKEVKGLFKKMVKTEAGRERREFLDQIAAAIQGHTTIEEEIFYPAVKGLETKKAEEMVAEALEEHHVVKLVLEELPELDVEDEQFEAKMTVLSELVEHHADEEEDEMFKTARKIGEAELEDLGTRMEARFEEVAGKGRRRAA